MPRCVWQEVTAEKFEESPIIFGDYIKMGAGQADRLYEELTDMKKLHNVLSEVRLTLIALKLHSAIFFALDICYVVS